MRAQPRIKTPNSGRHKNAQHAQDRTDTDADININTRAKSGSPATSFSDTRPNAPVKTESAQPAPADSQKISIAARAAIALIHIYKIAVSPALHLLGGGCRFFPTCSEYTALCIAHHGFFRGAILGACRILRCNPLCRGGLDYPPKIFSLKKLFSQNSVDEFGDFDKNPRI